MVRGAKLFTTTVGSAKTQLGNLNQAGQKAGTASTANLALIRRNMIRTQRIVKALGGELSQGLALAMTLNQRATQKYSEGALRGMEKRMVVTMANTLGWNKATRNNVYSILQISNAVSKFQVKLGRIGEHFQKLAAISRPAFLAITGGVLGWVTAGLRGTAQGQRFTFLFSRLSQLIASIFLPIIDKVLHYLQILVNWFQQLSGAQQKHIRGWLLGAAAATGMLMLFPRIIAGIGGITGAVQYLLLQLGLLEVEEGAATAGILPLIGLAVSGLTALVVGTEAGRNALSRLGAALAPLGQKFGELLMRMEPVLNALLDAFVQIEIEPIINGLIVVADAFSTILDLAQKLNGELGRMIGYLTKIPGLGPVLRGLVVGAHRVGADKSGRSDVTPGAGSFEAVTQTFKRAQEAALRSGTDYAKQTAQNTDSTSKGVERILAYIANGVADPFVEIAQLVGA